MNSRRRLLTAIVPAFVALALVAGSALADELLGFITEVDEPGSKITVIEKGSDNEVIVTVTEDTQYVTPKGESKIALKKVAKAVSKAKEKGAKGIPVKVEHKDGVASSVRVVAKKKAATKD